MNPGLTGQRICSVVYSSTFVWIYKALLMMVKSCACPAGIAHHITAI